MFPEVPTLGAFVYFEGTLGDRPELVRQAIRGMLARMPIEESELQMALYRSLKQGGWRKFKWSVVDEALASSDIEVVDLLVGNSLDVRFTAKIQLRRDPERRPEPFQIAFVCESERWAPAAIADAGRHLCELAAELDAPLSGAVFRTPILIRALGEIDQHVSMHGVPDRYPMPRGDSPRDRLTKARRLYPITLLGPKLASRLSAADATAAGALAVREINGSLLIDASPTIVETWDPDFLRATVELRRWLWPYTIQNEADAVGLKRRS